MIVIREFAWSDHDAVEAVWKATGRDVIPRAELEAKLTRDPELFLVAEATGTTTDEGSAPDGNHASDASRSGRTVVAAVLGTYDGRRGWIFRLAVHPSHRRAGIATRLVAELESRLSKLGCPRVNLMVMPDNVDGLRFWQALGYLPVPDVLCTKPLCRTAVNMPS